ncbi:MAG: 1-(5-phosphoribosyl)-5-[(5-phosphoribosylamino)methylideneamino]imidazole-4-carboxamide isomerase, partial [Anaerolineales bacterium]
MSFMIYPAIDLRNGKVARLKEGDLNRITFYNNDPVQVAREFMNAGAPWLHVVNLDGAFDENDFENKNVLEKLIQLNIQIQFGGGLRSLNQIEKVLMFGVKRIVLGTIAIEQPELVKKAIQTFGAANIAVSIDARNGFVYAHGWKTASKISAPELALHMRDLGVETAIFTDIQRDGLGAGLNISAAQNLMQTSGLNIIASGGVHTIDDVLAARDANLAGVIIG